MIARRSLATLAATALSAPLVARAQTRWVMATAYPDGNYHTQNIRQFIQEIEQGTNGRIAVQLHSNASLLPMPQIKRAVQTGQIQMGEILLASYGNEDPFFEIDFIPFLADTWPRAAALDQVSLPIIRARLDRQGVTMLYTANWPSQGFWTQREISRVEDLRGTRFRAQTAVLARMAELLGASPVTVQQAEVPQAFSAGIVNVMVTSAQTGVDTSAWDYTRYAYFVGFTLVRNAILVNSRIFNGLDDATKGVFRTAAERAAARGPGLAQESERTMTARLRQQGMILPEASAELLAGLRAIGERQTQDWAQRAGPEGQQMLERYRALIR